jgi:hypothetical protein
MSTVGKLLERMATNKLAKATLVSKTSEAPLKKRDKKSVKKQATPEPAPKKKRPARKNNKK